MKTSTIRMISILAAILLIIASVFVYSFLIKPIYSEIFESRNKTAALERNFENYKSLNDKFQKIFSQYQNLRDLEKHLSTIFPSKFDVAYASNQVFGIAKNNKLNLLSLTAKQMTTRPGSNTTKGIGILRMEAKLSGAYENFKMFLNDLESNMLISDLASFKIEKQKSGVSDLLYTIIIDTYYQAE